MTFTLVTITGTFEDADGNAATGSVHFDLTQPMRDTDENITRVPTRVTKTLVNGVLPSTQLAANDDPSTDPQGTGYYVTYEFAGMNHTPYLMFVSSLETTIDLADVVPATGAQPVTYYRVPEILASRYGVVMDVEEDQSVALNRAFDAASAAGGLTVRLDKPGTCWLDYYNAASENGVAYVHDNCKFLGLGKGASTVKAIGASADAFAGLGVHGLRLLRHGSNVTIGDMTIDGNKDAVTSLKEYSAILVRPDLEATNIIWENLEVINQPSNMSLYTINGASTVVDNGSTRSVTIPIVEAINFKIGDNITVASHTGSSFINGDHQLTAVNVTSKTVTFLVAEADADLNPTLAVAGTGGTIVSDVDSFYEGFGLETNGSSQVTIRNIHAHHNAGSGVAISSNSWGDEDAMSHDVTVENSLSEYNGWNGFTAYATHHVTFKNVVGRYNSNGVTSAPAANTAIRGRGINIEWSHDVTIDGFESYDNNYYGLASIGHNENIRWRNGFSKNNGANVSGDGTNASGAEFRITGGTWDTTQSNMQSMYLDNVTLTPATGKTAFVSSERSTHNYGKSIGDIYVSSCPGAQYWVGNYGNSTTSLYGNYVMFHFIDLPLINTFTLIDLTTSTSGGWSKTASMTPTTTGPLTDQRSAQAYLLTATAAARIGQNPTGNLVDNAQLVMARMRFRPKSTSGLGTVYIGWRKTSDSVYYGHIRWDIKATDLDVWREVDIIGRFAQGATDYLFQPADVRSLVTADAVLIEVDYINVYSLDRYGK